MTEDTKIEGAADENVKGEVSGEIQTKKYEDGTTATGVAPLPDQSPAEQDAAKNASEHVNLLLANTSSLSETIQGISVKGPLLTEANPADVVELDRQVTHAHGILHAVHERMKELLGG